MAVILTTGDSMTGTKRCTAFYTTFCTRVFELNLYQKSPIKSKFVGRASLENVLPPESYTIVGEGKGGPAGNVKVTAKVELLEEESETVISYEVDAKITGKLAQLGGPIVRKATEKLSEQFFNNLQEILAKNPNAINEPEEVELPDKTRNKRLQAIVILAILSYAAYLIF